MVYNSKVDAEVYYKKVPLIKGVEKLAMMNMIPGGTLANLEYMRPYVRWDDRVTQTSRLLLCDAQTSGGLLISIAEKKADKLLNLLHKKGIKDQSNIKIMILDVPIGFQILFVFVQKFFLWVGRKIYQDE